MSDFDQSGLRAEDFRRAWPTALATAMKQAEEIFDKIEAAQERAEHTVKQLADQREQLEELAAMTPHMIGLAKNRMSEATQLHVESISRASRESHEAMQALIEALKKEQAALQATRAAIDLQQAGVARAQEKLHEEKARFNSLSFWRRITARA